MPGVEGEPARGFVVGTVTAEPPTVELVGPATALSGVTDAITEPVSVAGATRTVVETGVTVGSPDPLVRLRGPVSARVTVNITPAPVEWDVADLFVQVRNATRPVQVVPRQIKVHVRGPADARSHVPTDFDVSIDVTGLRPGQYDLPVRVVPPSRIGVTEVIPRQVRVRIK